MKTDIKKKGLLMRYKVSKRVGKTDPKAEYFVLRLDEGGSDKKHIASCRVAIQAYADAIEKHIPKLAKDIRKRWPVKEESDAVHGVYGKRLGGIVS